MRDLPKQVHPLLRKVLRGLPSTWGVVKKKDHYFLVHRGRRVACVANNASTQNDQQAKKSLHTIQRHIRENNNGPDNSRL